MRRSDGLHCSFGSIRHIALGFQLASLDYSEILDNKEHGNLPKGQVFIFIFLLFDWECKVPRFPPRVLWEGEYSTLQGFNQVGCGTWPL